PGDLYGSLAPTLLVRGVAKAISERRGRLVYVANLLNKPNQTAGFGAEDYVAEVERFADCQMDMVVQNTGDVDEGWLVGHAQPGEQIVRPADNLPGVELIGLDMVDRDLEPDMTKSMVTKSFVRHDGSRVAGALLELAYA
ncbi:YvcK family protein, partial [Candidatus Saccharibacteria bacterium]|nr:YvcK family protein [Candidatus Saccharibacteria bacterium]